MRTEQIRSLYTVSGGIHRVEYSIFDRAGAWTCATNCKIGKHFAGGAESPRQEPSRIRHLLDGDLGESGETNLLSPETEIARQHFSDQKLYQIGSTQPTAQERIRLFAGVLNVRQETHVDICTN